MKRRCMRNITNGSNDSCFCCYISLLMIYFIFIFSKICLDDIVDIVTPFGTVHVKTNHDLGALTLHLL